MIEYRLGVEDRLQHLFRVALTLPRPAPRQGLMLPVWLPGSYLVREFARHLQEVRATDEQGRALAVTKRDKATWVVRRAGAERLRLSYRVYAYDLTVRAAHLDDSHASAKPSSRKKGRYSDSSLSAG